MTRPLFCFVYFFILLSSFETSLLVVDGRLSLSHDNKHDNNNAADAKCNKIRYLRGDDGDDITIVTLGIPTTSTKSFKTAATADHNREFSVRFSPNEYYEKYSPKISADTATLHADEAITHPSTRSHRRNPRILFELRISEPNMLSTLIKVSYDLQDGTNSFQPIGRSYDVNPWEISAGKYTQFVSFTDCNSIHGGNTCLIDLSMIDISPGAMYFWSNFEAPDYSDRDIAARFLEQATFGPTTTSIDELVATNLNFAFWIQQQQKENSKTSSHREIFRQRINARQAPSSIVEPSITTTQPCQKGTRYRLHAFSEADIGKNLTITTFREPPPHDQLARLILSVDGQVRTMVRRWPAFLYFAGTLHRRAFEDGDYKICRVTFDYSNSDAASSDSDDGTSSSSFSTSGRSILKLTRHDIRQPINCHTVVFRDWEFYGTSENPTYISNPPIRFDEAVGIWPEHVLELGDDDATPIDENYLVPIGSSNNPEIQLQRHVHHDHHNICGLVNPNNVTQLFFAKWKNGVYIHDPRNQIFDNTAKSPLPDGGGEILVNLHTPDNDYGGPRCFNVPRTFLNEEGCYMSESPHACSATSTNNDDGDGTNNTPHAYFKLSHETIRIIYEETGAGAGGTMYLYAVDGLNIQLDPNVQSPCTPGVISRWIHVACGADHETSNSTASSATVSDATAALLGRLISEADRGDPYFVEIRLPTHHGLGGDDNDETCDDEDMDLVGFEIPNIDGNNNLQEGNDKSCWKNVHPDHLNVYDFTGWTRSHPGNSDRRNPIKEFAQAGQSRLLFPDWHDLNRWNNFKRDNDNNGQDDNLLGRIPTIPLGGQMNYFSLPADVRTANLARALGLDELLMVDNNSTGAEGLIPTNDNNVVFGGIGTLVCGSPNEVANDPSLGGAAGRGSFITSAYGGISNEQEKATIIAKQREVAWTIAALTDPGQLRQRIAWALSQILVISPSAFSSITKTSYTEPFLVYYDIFVRHAFGNYRDVLKEVSYSPMMATMLSYYSSKSTAHVYATTGNVEYADENYAREIMQLFTTGLFRLNQNGTQIVDQDGKRQLVYSNDDIEEYARAWTGFISQKNRGNVEGDLQSTLHIVEKNLIDPMRIKVEWRDPFPKMGLNRMYIGDGYPLCSDLPAQHFLKKGATYRLLGKTPTPELQEDPPEWRSAEDSVHISLDDQSQLFAALCASGATQRQQMRCSFPAKIELDSSLPCYGVECEVDTIRSVEVMDGVFYEYVRPPCCQQTFYSDPKVIFSRHDETGYICGNPLTEVASVACCDGEVSVWNEMYSGERTLFSTALDRCGNSTSRLCSHLSRPNCGTGSICLDNNYFWSELPCQLLVKINAAGKVSVIHASGDLQDDSEEMVNQQVNEYSKTFFRVNWEDSGFDEIVSDCENIPSCRSTLDGMCKCEVEVTDETVFEYIPSKDEILSSLYIGAFDAEIFRDTGMAMDSADVLVHNLEEGGGLTMHSIFEFLDENDHRQLRKNMRSNVHIKGTPFKFRNPPHFISFADPEPRDAHYETDATLDHYLYHLNTPPFLAIRFAQRFGISNPSPGYIDSIAKAFRMGQFEYTDDGGEHYYYGSGEYGDLAATFAVVLLHPEARSVVLDADPAHGGFKEPLLKIFGLIRALGFELHPNEPWLEFGDKFGEMVGQMAHQLPSVFSFFLPEYQPPGSITKAGLVAPEAKLLTGPRIISTMNGIFSMIKFGLNNCFGGFGRFGDDLGRNSFGRQADSICNDIQIGQFNQSSGYLTYHRNHPTQNMSSSATRAIVDDLATLMTAGRLSKGNRELVETVLLQEETEEGALQKAQLLIASSPEFHSTNLVRKSGGERPDEPTRNDPSSRKRPYKALVYIMLTGGCDSYNLLVPHTCNATNEAGQTPAEQYQRLRTDLALTEEERTRIINANNNNDNQRQQTQPCEQFAIHKDLPVVERLYNSGELAFFANTGTLDVPVAKNNYYALTQSELFAHNTMQQEARRMDPFDLEPDTGILGRMCDVLQARGYNPQPITIQDSTIATVSGRSRQSESGSGSTLSPMIIAPGGTVPKFAPGGPNDLKEHVARMNDATSFQSSIFGETWSQHLQKSISDTDLLANAIQNIELTQDYYYYDDSMGAAERGYLDKVQSLAQTILTYEDRGSNRDVLYMELGGWDHHQNMKNALSNRFQLLNTVLTKLEQEMKSHTYSPPSQEEEEENPNTNTSNSTTTTTTTTTLWDQVAIVVTSEFGRTLTPNSGGGSDHAWGGNYMILGGSVKGGQIYGDYPLDLTEAGPLNIGRGRLIPTTSWESILNGVAEWMGIDEDDEDDLEYCMPNRHKTGTTLFTKLDLFHPGTDHSSSNNNDDDDTGNASTRNKDDEIGRHRTLRGSL